MDLQSIKKKIIIIRGQEAILDSEVTDLYGVETKHIDQADIKNNLFLFDKIQARTTFQHKNTFSKANCLTAKTF